MLLLRFFTLFILGGLCPLLAPAQSDAAAQKGCQFLLHIQQQNGAICDTINPLFNVWETILAANALLTAKKDTHSLAFSRALHYLQQNENAQGLICHNTKCKEGYCLETTAEYCLLLAKAGQQAKCEKAISQLLKLQKPAGDWDIGNPNVQQAKNFPSVTGFSLTMLPLAQTPSQEAAQKATNWLLQAQNSAGHWGNTWEYYDCPAYALWAVLRALATDSSETTLLAKQKALAYILAQQQSNGSWEFQGNPSPKKPSPELQTALMLLALQTLDFEQKTAVVAKGTAFLRETQQANGAWEGGFFPIASPNYVKKEYVFATSVAILALLTSSSH